MALWAAKKVGRPVKWTGDRTEAFLTDAHGRDHVTNAEMAFDADSKFLGLRVKTHRQSRRLHVDLLVVGADLSLRDAAVGPVQHPGDLRRGEAASTPTPRRSTPIAAPAGPRRPSWSSAWWKPRRAQLKVDPAELRRKNFITPASRTRRRSIMAYDVGDYQRVARRGAEGDRLCGLRGAQGRGRSAKASCAASASPATSRPAASRRRRRSAALGAGVGLWESAEVRVNPTGTVEVLTGSHSHGQGHETTFAQLVVGAARHADRARSQIVHGDTDKVPFGMGTYGSRSLAVGGSAIVKAMDKIEAKAKKIAAHLLEAAEDDIVFENGEFKVAGTDKSIALPMVALAAYVRAQSTRRHGAGPEGNRVLRPDQLHLPGRRLHLRGRGRSRHRQDVSSSTSSRPTISAG